jgi:adenylylsulfate kinase
MYKEDKSRTLFKTITWRVTATVTTISLVFIFTGRIDIALEIGFIEVLAKMLFYYLHERGWGKIRWGKREIPSFVVWISGIPKSGKTTLGEMIYSELKKDRLKIQKLDSHDVRPLFPETGFTREEVDNHIRRVGHLASMLEKNGVITIASFVSPYRESRKVVRDMCKNFVEVHLDTTIEKAKKYDHDNFYKNVEAGKYKHVPGYDVEFEKNEQGELHIDMTVYSLAEARDKVLGLLKKRYLN